MNKRFNEMKRQLYRHTCTHLPPFLLIDMSVSIDQSNYLLYLYTITIVYTCMHGRINVMTILLCIYRKYLHYTTRK